MKRFFALILFLMIALTSVSCSDRTDHPKLLAKEGIEPYELSESEKYILQSLGLDYNTQIISFHAPKEAITLNVNVYRLGEDKKWCNIGGGATSIGKDKEPVEQLVGTFTMQLKENHAIDFNINASGRASYKTEEIILDSKTMQSMKCFFTGVPEGRNE